MTRSEVEMEAFELESGLKDDGIWDKIDFLVTTRGEFVIVRENEHLVVLLGSEFVQKG